MKCDVCNKECGSAYIVKMPGGIIYCGSRRCDTEAMRRRDEYAKAEAEALASC